MPLELQIFHLHHLPKLTFWKPEILWTWQWKYTSLAARETSASPQSSSFPYSPDSSLTQLEPQENKLQSAKYARGQVAQFAKVSAVEIVSWLESPPLILHLMARVLAVLVLQHSQSPFEEGSIWRLLREDKPVVLHRLGGGADVNLFELHKGSLIITNCLVNHKRYLVINGNNNRLYQPCTL